MRQPALPAPPFPKELDPGFQHGHSLSPPSQLGAEAHSDNGRGLRLPVLASICFIIGVLFSNFPGRQDLAQSRQCVPSAAKNFTSANVLCCSLTKRLEYLSTGELWEQAGCWPGKPVAANSFAPNPYINLERSWSGMYPLHSLYKKYFKNSSLRSRQ